MKEIPLSRGKVALVDDEDYERLMQYKWVAYCDYHTHTWYAHTTVYIPFARTIKMSRFIMGTTGIKKVDHIDHNGLHNYKSNLRNCTNAENMANQKLVCTNSSGYKGVNWDKYAGKWQSRICIDGRRMFLGYHTTPELAAAAYDVAASKLRGDFALTNAMLIAQNGGAK